jgi:GNAT superfamily N-acetyltransferase
LDLKRLEPDDARPAFSCGDSDLDEFYSKDSIEGCKQLLSVTYVFLKNERAAAFFSVLNDSIRKQDGRSAFEKILRTLPQGKRYPSMPAVKIGRLGICKEFQGAGYGTSVLDFLKAWFTIGNKTGCRFLIVDAYNEKNVTKFYAKNGFRFLTGNDKSEKTRIMYFDLIKFRE